ncbi:hypothetical protein Tco_1422920 [Tanacetum coccineum]
MVVQAQEEIGEGSAMPTDPHHTAIITQPSSSQPQRKQKSRRPKEKDTQAPYLGDYKFKEESPEVREERRGKKIHDIDADEDITLENVHNAKMFDVNDLHGDEVVVESKVTDKAGEKRNIVEEAVPMTDAVTIPVSVATITNVELNLAQTLAKLKSARPKTKEVVMQEPNESTLTISLQLPSQVKGQGSMDKGKAKIIEPEKPLKKKDQIKFDEEEALRLQAKEKEETLYYKKCRRKEEQATYKSSTKEYHVYLPEEYGRMEAQRLQEQVLCQYSRIISQSFQEEEVAVDAIPLATKPLSIVDGKIVKEGKISYYQIIRADGSSKRYSTFIQMLRSFDREDLETLWKLVKSKHGYTRPEDGYERVLWGDLKTTFEHHVKDAV